MKTKPRYSARTMVKERERMEWNFSAKEKEAALKIEALIPILTHESGIRITDKIFKRLVIQLSELL